MSSLPTPLPTPHHFIRLHHPLGTLHIDASFALSAPWTVLFGPSGSGKTTILRAIAGLTRPGQASILRHDGAHITQLTDIKAFLPPHQRRIGYAPQRASLFPHLTVQQNVAYGAIQNSDGNPADNPSKTTVAEIIALFHLEPLAQKLPAHLSGGERQRVNLARAFAASSSRLLLLDEPFAGLDHSLRDTLLPAMQAWLNDHKIPVLSVTHDVVEALQLQATVVSIHEGKVTAQGPAATILAPERTRLLTHLT